jgi:hypothetical protein
MEGFKEVRFPPIEELTQQVVKGYNIFLLVTISPQAIPIDLIIGDNTPYNSTG